MAKLTREQVAQLSDVELNRGIAWCYPTDGCVWNDGFFHYCSLKGALNYLADYNLTMPLAVKYRLCIQPAKASPDAWLSYDKHGASSFMRANPLRAICEVLLMIAMEK